MNRPGSRSGLRTGPAAWPVRILKPLLLYYIGREFMLLLLLNPAVQLFLDSAVPGNGGNEDAGVGFAALFLTALLDILLVPLFFRMYRSDGRSLRRPPDRSRELGFRVYIAAVFGFLACYGIVNFLVSALGIPDMDPAFREGAETVFTGNIPVAFFAVGVAGPLMEELLFRGILMNRLRERLPETVAIILQAGLFGVFHGNLTQGTAAFLTGLMLGHCVMVTQSLAPAVLMHAAANLTALFLSGTEAGNRILHEKMMSLYILVFWAAGTVLYFKVFRKKRFRRMAGEAAEAGVKEEQSEEAAEAGMAEKQSEEAAKRAGIPVNLSGTEQQTEIQSETESEIQSEIESEIQSELQTETQIEIQTRKQEEREV